MSTNFVPSNSMPFHNKTGYDDQSVPPLVKTPVGDPIHKPWVLGYAARGREDEAYPLSGDNLFSFAGRSVVDFRSEYATFNTPFLRMFNQNANDVIFQRVVPDDAKLGTFRFYAEKYIDKVPVYERDVVTGQVRYDSKGAPVVKEMVDGPVIIIRKVAIDDDAGGYGAGRIIDGNIQGSDDNVSKLHPLWDMKGPYRGKDVNGFGLRMGVCHANSTTSISQDFHHEVGARVYTMQWVETIAGISSPVIWPTLKSTSSVMFSFAEGASHAKTKLDLDIDDVVPSNYQKRNPEVGMIPDYGPFEKFHVYRENIKAMQDAIMEALGDNAPVSADLIDIFQGVDLDGNPYDGVSVNPSSVSDRAIINERHVHYLEGGSDGTMSMENYDELVRKELTLFPDRGNIRFDDELKYSLGILWDSGYSLETKEAMVNFISRSRNTFLGLCTHVYDDVHTDNRDMQMQTEESRKIYLNELVSQAPESSLWGTAGCRGVIMGQTGVLRNSTYRGRVPCIYSLANMFSRYCGSSEGTCKPQYRFNRGALTVIEDLTDVTLTWKGNSVYASDWDASLISVSSYNMWEVHIKAIQSIYNEERSVLNNALVSFILTYVYRVADRVWADHTGEDRRTREEIAKDIQNEIISRLSGRIDEIVDINPVAYFTEEDINRGNSITVDINAYGNVLFTRMNTTIRVFRRG